MKNSRFSLQLPKRMATDLTFTAHTFQRSRNQLIVDFVHICLLALKTEGSGMQHELLKLREGREKLAS